MAHRNARDRNLAPRLRRTDQSIDFAGQFDSSAFTKTETADVFVKFLLADAEGEFGCADVARFDENVLHRQVREGPVVVQGGPAKIPEAFFTENRRIGIDFAFVEGGCRGHDFESGARLHHVDDGAVFHFLRLRFRAPIEIKIRAVGHRQDFASLRPHQNNDCFFRSVFPHGGVDFIFDDVLQVEIDSEVDLITVLGRALLSTIKNDLLAGPIMLDVTVPVLSMEIFLHRSFHALNAVMVEIGESDDVTKH